MKRKTIIHGELLLLPVDEADMSLAVKKTDYVVAHSETGHDHILKGNCAVLERPGKNTLILASEDLTLFHKKESDRHKDITVKKGIYKVLIKQTYNPYSKLVEKVKD